MKLTGILEYPLQKLGETDETHFELVITAPGLQKQIDRKPLNLSIVIDRSGSMSGSKLSFVKKAVKTFVKNLSPQDILSIVTYDDRVELVRPAAELTNKNEILNLIDTIHDGGTTNLSGGWELGFKQVKEKLSDKHINRVILLTDGLANEGVTSPKDLAKLGRHYKKDGVVTTAFGVGQDFDEKLLKQIADESSGNYYFIENPDQTPEFFKEEVGELLSLVAQELSLKVDFLNSVELKHIYTDYIIENQEKKSITLKLDDAYADDEKLILFQLDFPAVHEAGNYEIAKALLKHRRLIPSIEEIELEGIFNREVKTAEEINEQNPDERLLKDLAIFKAAEARRLSYEFSKTGDYDSASKTLISASTEINEMSDTLHSMGAEHASRVIKLESGDLKNDESSLKGSKSMSEKDILFKSRSAFRQKSKYKKKIDPEDIADDNDNNSDEDSEG